MDCNELIRLIGEPDDSPDVEALLMSVGASAKLRVPKGDTEARVTLPKLGLSLVFDPKEKRSSVLIFTAVQFFSDLEEGFTSFDGVLPGGVLFSDTPESVRQKLGKPAKTNKDMRKDLWTFDGLRLSVHYSRTGKGIAMVAVQVPPE